MKVKKLIKLLKNMNPDTHVFVSGYEGGYHCVSKNVLVTTMVINAHKEHYYGPHELYSNTPIRLNPDRKNIPAYILLGEDHRKYDEQANFVSFDGDKS